MKIYLTFCFVLILFTPYAQLSLAQDFDCKSYIQGLEVFGPCEISDFGEISDSSEILDPDFLDTSETANLFSNIEFTTGAILYSYGVLNSFAYRGDIFEEDKKEKSDRFSKCRASLKKKVGHPVLGPVSLVGGLILIMDSIKKDNY